MTLMMPPGPPLLRGGRRFGVVACGLWRRRCSCADASGRDFRARAALSVFVVVVCGVSKDV